MIFKKVGPTVRSRCAQMSLHTYRCPLFEPVNELTAAVNVPLGMADALKTLNIGNLAGPPFETRELLVNNFVSSAHFRAR